MEGAMSEGMEPEQPTPEGETPAPEGEAPTFVLGSEQFGGKKPKAGEKFIFEVVKVDPETGDAQMRYPSENPGTEPEDSMAAMDRQLPAGQDEESGSY